MAKLTRVASTVFGNSAGAQQIGVFGSFAAGSPQYAVGDPLSAQELSNWSTGWYAAVVGENSPAIQDFNSYCYVTSYQVSYLLQQGVPEYSSVTTYYTNSIVMASSGVLFQSLIDNNTGNSPTAGSQWALFAQAQRVPTQTRFISGSGTYTVPSGCKYIKGRLFGGGGGGAGSGEAGSGAGGAGAQTSFGTGSFLLIAGGGSPGGVGGDGTFGGVGGSPSVTIPAPSYAFGTIGGAGNSGTTFDADAVVGPQFTVIQAPGGAGAASPLGGGGGKGEVDGGTGAPSTGAGGTGGGLDFLAGSSNVIVYAGGGGGAGAYLEFTWVTPSGTMPYSIGGGGAPGSPGGIMGANGGAGANGSIILDEY